MESQSISLTIRIDDSFQIRDYKIHNLTNVDEQFGRKELKRKEKKRGGSVYTHGASFKII